MANIDLEQLERRIERLIDSYENACQENRKLKQRQTENERMTKNLRRRLGNVMDRIEKLEQE